MNNLLTKYILPPVVLLLGFGVFYLMTSGESKPRDIDNTQKAAVVRVSSVVAHEGGFTIDVDGVVEPFRVITLAPEVSGRISSKNELSREGNYVTKGTELFTVDPSDYQLEVDRLTEVLAQSKTELEELVIDHTNTSELAKLAYEEVMLHEKELKRLEALGPSITDSQVDQERRLTLSAKNRYLTAASQVQVLAKRHVRLSSGIRLASTQLKKAQLNLDRTKIVAPVDGVIVTDEVEEYSYFQAGKTLATLEDTSAVEVKCNLRMEELFWLWSQVGGSQTQDADLASRYKVPQVPVRIVYQLTGREETKYSWNGVLSRYDGIGLDERTRTVPCRVRVDRPSDVYIVGPPLPSPPALVRGMFVKVQITVEPPMPLVEVSELAVQPGNRIWRVTDGRLDLVDSIELIKLVKRDASEKHSNWLVDPGTSGLQPGDSVVVSQLSTTYDGMAVDVKADELSSPLKVSESKP